MVRLQQFSICDQDQFSDKYAMTRKFMICKNTKIAPLVRSYEPAPSKIMTLVQFHLFFF